MHTQHRIDIHIYWFGGLRDRLGRLNIDTLKGWLTPILAAVAVGLLALIYLSGRTLAPVPAPVPVPAPGKVDPKPAVDPDPSLPPVDTSPRPKDTPLSRAMRDYLRQAPVTLPDTLDAMADRLDSGELADKLSATVFFKKPASGVNAALDQVFSAGIDKDGKVTDPGKISGPLRDSARALRRAK